MPVWPSELPTAPLLGWTESPGNSLVRTQTDTGPAKLRRRFTSSPATFSIQLALYSDTSYTAIQKATRLVEFYENPSDGSPPGTNGGALTITSFPHPRDNSNATFRFLAPPVITQTSSGLFRASLRLEKV